MYNVIQQSGWGGRKEDTSVDSNIVSASPEEVFTVLSDSDSRAVLDYLEHTLDGSASIEELAASVSQSTGAGNAPNQLIGQLHHVHLPKLAEANLINYDPVNKTVQYLGHPLVEDCLALVNTE